MTGFTVYDYCHTISKIYIMPISSENVINKVKVSEPAHKITHRQSGNLILAVSTKPLLLSHIKYNQTKP